MATFLDIGFLKGASDIFVWLLIFLVVYGAFEVSNLLKNRGLHALLALSITAVVIITGGGTNIVAAMAPWAVVIAVMLFFILALGQFAGLDSKQVLSIFGGRGIMWYIFIPLAIVLIVAWTQGASGQKTVVNEAGETVTIEQPQRGFMEVLTNPKVLGLIVVMLIAAMTLILMGGGAGAVK